MRNLILFTLAIMVLIGSASFSAEPVEKEHAVYYFDNPRYIPLADSIFDNVRMQMMELVGDSLTYKPSIYIIEDINQFNRLIRGRIPDWGAAAAFPERKLIAVKSPDKFSIGRPLQELLAHEYSHLLLAQRTGFYRAPRWLDEGLAMLVSFQWGWEDNLAMSRAGAFAQFLSLKEIENMNRFEQSKVQIAYAESYLAVDYLFREYGKSAFRRLLDAIAAGKSLDSALNASIGGDYTEFEKEFDTHLKTRYNIASLFMDTIFFWLFLAAVVIVAGFVRYKKRREYYRKWEREEQLQSTDFDYGDPDHPERPDEEDEPWRS